MRRLALGLAAAILLAAPAYAEPAYAADAPTPPSSASASDAGAKPVTGEGLYKAFHERAGIARVAVAVVDLSVADPRISDIFKNQDIPRLKAMLSDQLCYLLNGPCTYTGKDMKTAHKDMGLQMSDFNALVENLQTAMDREHVPFHAQNRLLAKLAPMERVVVER